WANRRRRSWSWTWSDRCRGCRSLRRGCRRLGRRTPHANRGQWFALGAKEAGDSFGHFDSSLPGAPGQLVGLQLGKNFGQGKFDQRLVLVLEFREHTGWRSLAEFSKGDLHRTLLQLRQNFLKRNGNLNAANWGLAHPGP